jgi:hypothetical protein
MKTVLFSFPDDLARDHFLKIVKEVSDQMLSADTAQRDPEGVTAAKGQLLLSTLETARLDPPIKADHERVVALFVSGRKMAEGQLSDMRKRFQQECDSHKASVELRELRAGTWVVVQSRRLQRQQAL